MLGLADRLSVGDDRQHLHGRPRQCHRSRRVQMPTGGIKSDLQQPVETIAWA
jgi:hypothetical protein